MKKLILALCALTLTLTSCDFIEDIKDDLEAILIPDDATPSKKFDVPGYDQEPYAAYAQRLNTSHADDDPFDGLEFFGDGEYAMSGKRYASRAASTDVVAGTFTMPDATHYLLDDGSLVDITNLGAGTITFTPAGGNSIDISITADKALTSAATAALCRTWHLNTSKYWFTVKGFNALYRGYSMQNGQITHEDNGLADKVSFLANGDPMTKDVWPEYVSLSPFGTYFVRFASGKTALQTWKWSNENTGAIHIGGVDTTIAEYLRITSATVRFANDQFYLFGDLNIGDIRALTVSNFSAVK